MECRSNRLIWLLGFLMMHESFVTVPGCRMYCRHTEIVPTRRTLLLIHGLGESGLCFLEAFRQTLLGPFNIVVPDLPGFGKSDGIPGDDYSFPAQIRCLSALLDALRLRSIFLIGHSMGGDIGTLLCQESPTRVSSFINIEGDLDPSERFITTAATKADQEGRFEQWLRQEFTRGTVQKWATQWPSCVRYAASLEMCRTEAFRQCAHEIFRMNESLPGKTVGEIGEIYRQLTVRRCFCWGDTFSVNLRGFLHESALLNQGFELASHWVMVDQPQAFYSFAAGFFLSTPETTESTIP